MTQKSPRVTTSSGYNAVIHPQIVFNYTQVIPKRAQNLEKSAEKERHTSNTSYLGSPLVTEVTGFGTYYLGAKPNHNMLCLASRRDV
jgi:hypothetical protein